ncbi:MAG: SpoIIE family protein phosphatase [Desulfobacterales bacterium]|nr:SpoIIE family protein phosphatase [Desulfobacterales bacterium]
MNINRARRLRDGILICTAIILFAHLFDWLLPEVTSTWNNRIIDRVFRFRANSTAFRPAYDDTVVHVDINQSTLQRLKLSHLDRRHHAKAIANLGAMATASQLYDFIFAAERSANVDRMLVDAARRAGNVYFGLMFFYDRGPFLRNRSLSSDSPTGAYLGATRWNLTSIDNPTRLPAATDAIITFPQLAQVSRGLGSLNLTYDPDGVYRRYPLLYGFGDAVYPSIVLRLICDYLQVRPGAIVLEPGPYLTLKSARFPGDAQPRDIRIPIDLSGQMVIDFIGPWELMRHYDFADVLRASDNHAELALWKNELAGKIVVVSEVLSGSSDAGPVPTDTHYPLSGVHASALHTILTESFFQPATRLSRILSLLLLTAVVMGAFIYLPALAFGTVAMTTAVAYGGAAAAALLYFRSMFDFVLPIGMLFLMLVTMLVHRAIESTRLSAEARRERELVEKELEIGRRIQADFFPLKLPEVSGWKLAATIRPAKQVAGDFYDIFTLNESRCLAVLIGDVCGKGVGAAIFMALFRSLIRALCQRQAGENEYPPESGRKWAQHVLRRTIEQANNYIAVTHENAHMFATVFFALIDARSGEMIYVNCGQEPPLHLGADGALKQLTPTGPVLGVFPDATFGFRSVSLKNGDLFFACTDGVSEAPDRQGRLFPADGLHSILRASHRSLKDMLQAVEVAVDGHAQGESQFDDITMVAVQRDTAAAAHKGATAG